MVNFPPKKIVKISMFSGTISDFTIPFDALQATRAEEMERSRRHFETWQMLWGRPGHGAPRDVKVKENLDVILYHHLDRERGDRSDRSDRSAHRAAPPSPSPAPLPEPSMPQQAAGSAASGLAAPSAPAVVAAR